MRDSDQVRAAGGVVRRAGREGEQVLLVHRPRYADWTFPKGKVHDGESDEDAALREVEEETGFRCAIGVELPSTRYRDMRGRPKVVRYWTMTVESGAFQPHDEVDEIRWLSRAEAAVTLSYGRDVELLDAVPPPVLVMRHASAGDSGAWGGDDARRPLDDKGRRQASELVDHLAPFRIDRVVSSPFDRCVQTVQPLAAARGFEVELMDDLAEGAGPDRARAALAALDGTATAVCGHVPELEPIIGRTEKGATIVVEAANGAISVLGRLPPPG
jgi:8-oxo-dGTP pyrophosphatase MutT (NUDIX family)